MSTAHIYGPYLLLISTTHIFCPYLLPISTTHIYCPYLLPILPRSRSGEQRGKDHARGGTSTQQTRASFTDTEAIQGSGPRSCKLSFRYSGIGIVVVRYSGIGIVALLPGVSLSPYHTSHKLLQQIATSCNKLQFVATIAWRMEKAHSIADNKQYMEGRWRRRVMLASSIPPSCYPPIRDFVRTNRCLKPPPAAIDAVMDGGRGGGKRCANERVQK